MGYTHYWRQESEIPQAVWDRFTAKIGPKLSLYGDILDELEVTEERIWLNGVGDDAHETFVLERCGGSFSFCKTARKPYDPIVVACLVLLREQTKGGDSGFTWSSDGNPTEHSQGVEIAGLKRSNVSRE